MADDTLDLRGLSPRSRLATLLERLDALPPGGTLVLLSDHDPSALLARLGAEPRGGVRWRSLEAGPPAWRVEIARMAAPAPPDTPHGGSARRRVELDVREDIRRGVEPFARIMAAAAALGDQDELVLRAPFEPVPLYEVLRRRGLAHRAECLAPNHWQVAFFRAGAPATAPATDVRGTGSATPLDVRGLEPPEPMVRILERLDALEPGQTLEVWHERRPMFLYPQLEARGFGHETDEPQPGVIRIRIRRADGPA
jgi:uncharacterized protein (DUF2249 family)